MRGELPVCRHRDEHGRRVEPPQTVERGRRGPGKDGSRPGPFQRAPEPLETGQRPGVGDDDSPQRPLPSTCADPPPQFRGAKAARDRVPHRHHTVAIPGDLLPSAVVRTCGGRHNHER